MTLNLFQNQENFVLNFEKKNNCFIQLKPNKVSNNWKTNLLVSLWTKFTKISNFILFAVLNAAKAKFTISVNFITLLLIFYVKWTFEFCFILTNSRALKFYIVSYIIVYTKV